jgi:hypothetical protein
VGTDPAFNSITEMEMRMEQRIDSILMANGEWGLSPQLCRVLPRLLERSCGLGLISRDYGNATKSASIKGFDECVIRLGSQKNR